MLDLTTIPLEQLLQYCQPLSAQLTPIAEAAWRELLRRSLLQRNDSAWDALVQRLWPYVLHWIYSRRPDWSPTDVERLAQVTIWTFLQEYHVTPLTNELSDGPTGNGMREPSAFSSPFSNKPDSIALHLQRTVEELLHEPR